MENYLINPGSKTGKIIFTGLILLIISVIAYVVYKMFVEFKDNKVNAYIDNYANGYGSDAQAAKKVLQAGAKKLLLSYNETKAIKEVAKVSGTDIEYELVH